MSYDFNIPDRRSNESNDYAELDRRGRMKRSWSIGVNRRRDGSETLSFDGGLTWGSIGQILGYLLGEVEDGVQDELYEQLLKAYLKTDRGAKLRGEAVDGRFIPSLRFATWNLRYSGRDHSLLRANFLRNTDWDVIALQEVSKTAWEVLTAEDIAESGFYTLADFALEPAGSRPHGVAMLARNGFRLSDPRVLEGLPKTERALACTLNGLSEPVTVASWHAPNAAGEGVKVKMQGYQAITDWLQGLAGPVILGFDSNHWSVSTDLESPDVENKDSSFYLEKSFFGASPPHQLRDALIDYFWQDNAAYQRAIRERPNGPLAVSYIRGSSSNPTEDRFDYIFVSDDIEVSYCRYDYEGAKNARSDHGIVIADVKLVE